MKPKQNGRETSLSDHPHPPTIRHTQYGILGTVSPLPMAKNEKTSPRVARIAARLLRRSGSKKVRAVSASALTQSADRRKKRR